MNSSKTNKKDRSAVALSFFFYTLAFTFAGFALFAASQANFLPITIPYEIAWMAQFGPTVIAIVLVWIQKGADSSKKLVSRMVRWRFNPKWYAVALFTAPALATVVLLFNHIMGLETIEWTKFGSWSETMSAYLDMRIPGQQGPLQAIAAFAQESSAWLTIMIMIAFAIVSGGISEELGWRGYALSKLQENFTPLSASLIIGLYWSIWHIAPPIWKLLFSSGIGAFFTTAGITIGTYIVLSIPLSIIYVLIVNKSNASILPAILFHASYNLTTITLSGFWPKQWFFWQTIILLWIVSVIVVAVNRTHYLSLYEQNQPI